MLNARSCAWTSMAGRKKNSPFAAGIAHFAGTMSIRSAMVLSMRSPEFGYLHLELERNWGRLGARCFLRAIKHYFWPNRQ